MEHDEDDDLMPMHWDDGCEDDPVRLFDDIVVAFFILCVVLVESAMRTSLVKAVVARIRYGGSA